MKHKIKIYDKTTASGEEMGLLFYLILLGIFAIGLFYGERIWFLFWAWNLDRLTRLERRSRMETVDANKESRFESVDAKKDSRFELVRPVQRNNCCSHCPENFKNTYIYYQQSPP